MGPCSYWPPLAMSQLWDINDHINGVGLGVVESLVEPLIDFLHTSVRDLKIRDCCALLRS